MPHSIRTIPDHITWHDSSVTAIDRQQLLGQCATVLWFTGLSGSGKSTISVGVEQALFERGCLSYRLDGDNIRHGLNRDLGFSPVDRTENIRRLGEVCKLFVDSGLIVMAALVSPYRADRDQVRALLEPGQFIEIHVTCRIETCDQRDPKGLYAKAHAGEITEFTGVSAPYEPPTAAEITLDTDVLSVDESVQLIIQYLQDNQRIGSKLG